MVDIGERRFRDIIPLGRGGMGDVTLACLQGPSGFSKLQVIKRLRPEIAENPEFLEMFLHEARLAARLSHPNIVQTNDVGRDEDSYFIAMEYLEGQTLHALFRKVRRKDADPPVPGAVGEPTPLSGRVSVAPPAPTAPADRMLPLNLGLRIIADALEGLNYVHQLTDEAGTPLKLVHRDVSPANIFVSYDGTVKVLDFGIAKAANSDLYTRTGILKGKVPYMAPEQFHSRDLDGRCDLYAVGAILWEVAAGVRLWNGLSDLEIVTELMNGVHSPRTVNPDVHPKLEAICMKALALNAVDRYQSAAVMQADVEALLQELGGCTTRALGKYVATAFAAKRARQQGVVESKLREFRQSMGLRATGEHQLVPSLRSITASGGLSPVSGIGGEESVRSMRTPVNQSPPGMQNARTTGGMAAPNFRETQQQQRSGSGPWLFAASALILGLAIGGGAYWAVTSAAPPVAPKPVPTAPPPPTTPPPAQPMTKLSIRASPADTKLYLDDKPLTVNPYAGEVVRDQHSHVVRGEANGYTTETQLVNFTDPTADVKLELARQKKDGGR